MDIAIHCVYTPIGFKIPRRVSMRKKKPAKDKNRVYIECSETVRRVKGKIISKDDKILEVETPTGYVMKMQKKTKRGNYRFRIGLVEFVSDGREVV